MPCTKCKADFTLLTWKIKCIDCEQNYCSKCLRKMHGVLFCDICMILNKRPPDREKLMELRVKDLRDYLTKNRISTHGLVEKDELVELFYRRCIPVRSKRSNGRLRSVISGSVPNLAAQSQDHLNNLRTNLGTNITNMRSYAENAIHNLGRRVGPLDPSSRSNSPRPSLFEQQNMQFPFGRENYAYVYSQATSHSQNDIFQPTSSTYSTNIREEQPAETNSNTSPYKHLKLSDFNRVEDLNDLSVKQLKELLTRNRVDYKGCVEKTELLDRAIRLWMDNNQHKDEVFEEAPVDNLCKICMDAPLDCVILECGHMATCVDCGKQLAECPICRQFVTRVVRTFKA